VNEYDFCSTLMIVRVLLYKDCEMYHVYKCNRIFSYLVYLHTVTYDVRSQDLFLRICVNLNNKTC
jgi:hypothetical protein